jgi:hypothetical protein
MPFLVGALAALVVGAATLGSAIAAGVAFVFATAMTYLYLPVLAPDYVGLWFLAMATLAIGGGVAFWTRRRQQRDSQPVRAAILTMAAAPAQLLALIIISFVSTTSMFRAAAYASLIGKIDTVPFAQAIQRLDTTGPPGGRRRDRHRSGLGPAGRCRCGRAARPGTARPRDVYRPHVKRN